MPDFQMPLRSRTARLAYTGTFLLKAVKITENEATFEYHIILIDYRHYHNSTRLY